MESAPAQANRRQRGPAFRRTVFTVFGGILVAAIAYGAGFGVFGLSVAAMRAPLTVPKADGIVVLTGGRQRIVAAIDLLKSGLGKRLLISGVNPVTDRAALQAANGAAPALFSCCIDIDHAALDTIGNAEESAKWLRDRGYASAIVVTSNYHIPRSLLEMRRAVGNVDLIPYPVVSEQRSAFGWIADADAMRVLFVEYSKYVGALLRGTLDHISDRTSVAGVTGR